MSVLFTNFKYPYDDAKLVIFLKKSKHFGQLFNHYSARIIHLSAHDGLKWHLRINSAI